ncbi:MULTISPECIES: hypothetical protein [Niastella]|uniref:Uncharacterized protein n=1 Tax=Niastella soli TaxID=2821487 RepID=A0ABS3Z532_9BACT|nr:hypothetical protein [Niastella soli]MBO9205275.1 hypothetical protein [Niastella soli]
MSEKVNGFLVLRKSGTMDTVEPYKRLFRVGAKEYRGMERAHLYDIDEDYIKKKLPPDLHIIIKKNHEESNDLLFVELIRDLEEAKIILQYVRGENDLSELIAIRSDIISEIKGTVDIDPAEIEWLGYDILSFGNGSLILNGIFLKPDHFRKWVPWINDNGLFAGKEQVQAYIDDYLQLASDDIVEDHIPSPYRFDAVRIGRVLPVNPMN